MSNKINQDEIISNLQNIQKEYINELADTMITQTRLIKLEEILMCQLKDIARNHVDGWSGEYEGLSLKDCKSKIENENDFSPDWENMEEQLGSPLTTYEQNLYIENFTKDVIDCLRYDRGLKTISQAGRYADFTLGNKEHQKNVKELRNEINGLNMDKLGQKRMMDMLVNSYLNKLDIKQDINNLSASRKVLNQFQEKTALLKFMDKMSLFDDMGYNFVNSEKDKDIFLEANNKINKEFNNSSVFVKNYIIDSIKNELKDYKHFNNNLLNVKNNILNLDQKTDFFKMLKSSIVNDFEFKDLKNELFDYKKELKSDLNFSPTI